MKYIGKNVLNKGTSAPTIPEMKSKDEQINFLPNKSIAKLSRAILKKFIINTND